MRVSSLNRTDEGFFRQEQNPCQTGWVGVLIEVRVKSKRKVGQKPSFRLAQEDVEPCGGAEPLEAALKCLGPFGGGKIGPSVADDKEFAEHEIFEIARSYNWHRLLSAQSPRSKVVKKSLDELIRGTAAAFRAIQGLDDYARFMFGTCADHPSFSKLHSEANGKALPQCSYSGVSDRASPWLIQLNALHQLALQQRELFQMMVGEDRGGRSNLHKDLYISPEHQLIERGWYLFDFFKPGQAKGTLNNSFIIFLQSIFEYATGQGASEEGAPALLNKVKQMIAHLRELRRIREKSDAAKIFLDNILDEIVKRGFDDDIVARLSAMGEELEPLQAKVPATVRALRQSTSKKSSR